MPILSNQVDAIRAALDNSLADINTTFVAEVVSYNIDNQTATVRPVINRPIRAVDPTNDDDQFEILPDMPDVPVYQPRGNNTYIHVPLSAGDHVVVHVLNFDMSAWRATGNRSNPTLTSTHDMSSCFCIPCANHNRNLLASSQKDSNAITIGNGSHQIKVTSTQTEIGGNGDAAALASIVDSQLNGLRAKFNAWVPASGDGGAALKVALGDWLADTCNSDSQKLKVGG